MEKKDKISWIILATIIPILFTTCWVSINTQLPTADAINYLLTSSELYHQFNVSGFWHGLLNTYLHRGWRPTIFPVLVLPFMFLANGNLLHTCGLVAIVSILITVTYVYLYCRLMLAWLPAVLVTNMICLLPLVQEQVVGFYAECFFFPCIIGSLYHLIKSDYLNKVNHALAFSLLVSLAALLRPVEMVIHLIFVLILFLYIGWYQNRLSIEKIVTLVIITISSVLMFFIAASFYCLNFIANQAIDGQLIRIIKYAIALMAVTLVSMYVFIGVSRKPFLRNESNILAAFSLIFILILAWYAPYAFETLEWIYRTSLGDVAKGTTCLVQSSLLGEMKLQIMAEGNFVFYTSLLLALMTLIIQPRLRKLESIALLPIIYLLLVSIVPILEVLFTVQDIIRKLSTAFPALLMALLLVGLRKGPWKNIRFLIGSLILLVELGCLSVAVFAQKPFYQSINYMVGYYISRPVVQRPNPHEVIAEFLQNQSTQLGINAIGIEVHPNIAEPVDPFLLKAMVYALNTPLSADYPYISSYSSQSLRYLHDHYNALFLADKAVNMQVSNASMLKYARLYHDEKNPSIKAFYALLLLYSQHRLETNGWKVGPCIILNSLTQAKYRGCLLIAK